jgi:hypothetical protein
VTVLVCCILRTILSSLLVIVLSSSIDRGRYLFRRSLPYAWSLIKSASRAEMSLEISSLVPTRSCKSRMLSRSLLEGYTIAYFLLEDMEGSQVRAGRPSMYGSGYPNRHRTQEL